MRLLRYTVLAVLATVALSACDGLDILGFGAGLDARDFGAFDLDDDGFLNEAEFLSGFVEADVFDTFEVDGSGFIERDEFDERLGAFGAFDLNGDDLLTEQEFIAGMFAVFDTDADALVDEPEFVAGLELL